MSNPQDYYPNVELAMAKMEIENAAKRMFSEWPFEQLRLYAGILAGELPFRMAPQKAQDAYTELSLLIRAIRSRNRDYQGGFVMDAYHLIEPYSYRINKDFVIPGKEEVEYDAADREKLRGPAFRHIAAWKSELQRDHFTGRVFERLVKILGQAEAGAMIPATGLVSDPEPAKDRAREQLDPKMINLGLMYVRNKRLEDAYVSSNKAAEAMIDECKDEAQAEAMKKVWATYMQALGKYYSDSVMEIMALNGVQMDSLHRPEEPIIKDGFPGDGDQWSHYKLPNRMKFADNENPELL